ncbi:MAG: hypothetical protein ACXWV9_02280 [Flavisolibacter sp.]
MGSLAKNKNQVVLAVYHLRNAPQSILTMDWKQDINHKYYFINNRFVPFTA